MGWKNIDLFWLMISKSDDFEMCLNMVYITLYMYMFVFFSIFPSYLSEAGMNERDVHGQKHFWASALASRIR